MGLYVIPFAVDIKKVRSVFGCKDQNLLEEIKTADLYEHYSNEEDFTDEKYSYDFDEILNDIIFNYPKPEGIKPKFNFFGLKKSTSKFGANENMGHAYGYVLLVICDYLGTHLLPDSDGFRAGNHYDAAVSIIQEKGLKIDLNDIFEQHHDFDIPKNYDFPAIHCYSKLDIEYVCSIMETVDIDETKTDFANDDFDEVQDILQNIKDCFLACKEQDTEMIVFTH